jgi:hypothetical protein
MTPLPRFYALLCVAAAFAGGSAGRCESRHFHSELFLVPTHWFAVDLVRER